jgi:hypothetical protein
MIKQAGSAGYVSISGRKIAAILLILICSFAFAIWLSKMILATHSSARTFSFVGKQAGASIPTLFYGNG